MRFAPAGSDARAELVLSSPSLGPTDADSGLAAAGDVSGDAVVGWVQGDPASPAIVTDQLYQPPGSVCARSPGSPTRAPPNRCSPGRPRATSGARSATRSRLTARRFRRRRATSLLAPEPLADGQHSWQVTASNPAGSDEHGPRAARVWVDTVPPAGRLTITGTKRVGSYLHLSVSYTDAPPPEPPTSASGIARVERQLRRRQRLPDHPRQVPRLQAARVATRSRSRSPTAPATAPRSCSRCGSRRSRSRSRSRSESTRASRSRTTASGARRHTGGAAR